MSFRKLACSRASAANRATSSASATLPRLIAAIAELNLAYSCHVFASARGTPWKPRYNFDHWRIFEAYARADLDQASALLARHINAVDRVRPARTAPGRSG